MKAINGQEFELKNVVLVQETEYDLELIIKDEERENHLTIGRIWNNPKNKKRVYSGMKRIVEYSEKENGDVEVKFADGTVMSFVHELADTIMKTAVAQEEYRKRMAEEKELNKRVEQAIQKRIKDKNLLEANELDGSILKDIGDMYFFAKHDYESAIKMYELGAEKGDMHAQVSCAMMYYFGQGTKQDLEKALRWFKQASRVENKIADYYLGVMAHSGIGVEKNDKAAKKFFERSARKGNSKAAVQLGLMYHQGFDYAMPDDVEAYNWFNQAARQGDSDGQYMLGVMLYYGYGREVDYPQAKYLFKTAAELDHVDALCALGYMYHLGQGVKSEDREENDIEARQYFMRAAKLGSAQAELHLGLMDYNGWGNETKEPNFEEAMNWFKKASDHGNSIAKSMLGMMIHRGEGTEKDNAEALRLMKESAEEGYLEATIFLKNLYSKGNESWGIQADPDELDKWNELVFNQSNAFGNMEDQLEFTVAEEPDKSRVYARQ